MSKQACSADKGVNHDCEDIYTWECYDPGVRDDCCVTCVEIQNSFNVTVPGCEYGDRTAGCQNSTGPLGRNCYYNEIRQECCKTCFSLESSIPGCPFGDRVAGCSNTVGPNGRHCYNNTIRQDCCDTCFSFESDIPGCTYGDKAGNCQSNLCPTYNTQRRQDCCDTCYDPNSNPKPTDQTQSWTFSTAFTTTGSESTETTGPLSRDTGSSGSPDWVVPVAAAIGGVIVLVVLILVACIYIRRRKKKPEAVSDEMYKEYKLSKRAPVAPPRPETEVRKNSKLQRQDSAEYAYIHPDDVASNVDEKNSLKKREGNDPLPKAPIDYVYLTNRDKYGYLEPVQRSKHPGPYTDLTAGSRQPDPYAHLNQATDEKSRRSNSYGEFPLVAHDNKGFNVESEKL